MTAMHDFIWLASQSPRRQQLLTQLGVAHQTLLPGAHEDAQTLERLEDEQPGEWPADYVQRVTRAKLKAACERWRQRDLPSAPILCADTTVALGRRILGKPANAEQARKTLAALSGRTHRVLTAVALMPTPHQPRAKILHVLSVSHVRFATLSAQLVADYVASGDPFGKAGSYAIQGALAGWIEHIEGSHSGIMGLPLFETTQLLVQSKVRMTLWPCDPLGADRLHKP